MKRIKPERSDSELYKDWEKAMEACEKLEVEGWRAFWRSSLGFIEVWGERELEE